MSSDREKKELYKTIWSIADDLRGSVDGWDFKQYVLGIMFYRYISEPEWLCESFGRLKEHPADRSGRSDHRCDHRYADRYRAGHAEI